LESPGVLAPDRTGKHRAGDGPALLKNSHSKDRFMSAPVDEVTRLAEEAVTAFQERANGSLDYSIASLVMIDEILAESAPLSKNWKPENLDWLIQLIGCYILEVARRAHGGKIYWFKSRNQPVLAVGEPHFKIALLTWDRVRQRLAGDHADNIPFYFDGFSQRVLNAVDGDDVLCV
jgi:hypothetical protein